MDKTQKDHIEEMKRQVKFLKETVQKYDSRTNNKTDDIPKSTVKRPIPLKAITSASPIRNHPIKYKDMSITSEDHKESIVDAKDLENLGEYKLLTKQELISTINSYKSIVKSINKKALKAMETVELKYKKEISTLRRKYDIKKSKIKKLLTELEQVTVLRNDKEGLTKELEATRYNNNQIEQELEGYMAKIAEMEKTIKNNKKIAKDIKTVKKENEGIHKQLNDTMDMYKAQLEETNLLKSAIITANQTREQSEKEYMLKIKMLESDLNYKDVELEKTNAKCSALEKEIDAIKTKQIGSKDDLTTAEESLKKFRTQIGDLEIRIAKLTTENKFLTEKVEDTEKLAKFRSEDTSKVEEKLESAIKDTKRLDGIMREKDGLLEFKTNLIEHLQQKSRDYESQIEQFKIKEKGYLVEYQVFLKDYNGLETKYLKLKQEYIELGEENEIMKSKILKSNDGGRIVTSMHEIKPKPDKIKQLDEINSMIVQYRRTKM